MFFDQDASPSERRVAFGLPPAPDDAFAQDWDAMDVTAQLVELRAPYQIHEHASAKEQQAQIHLVSRRHAATTTMLLDRREEERIEIERERARRNGEVYQEAPPIHKDPISGGPDFLYREPRVQNKPQCFAKKAIPIPCSASSHEPMLHRNLVARLTSDDRARCVRDCRRCLDDALQRSRVTEGGMHLFVDNSFFVGARASQYPEGTPTDAAMAEPRDVLRLTHLYPDGLVFDPSPPPYALVSTTSRLHHVVAAMELARSNGRTDALMETLITTDPAIPAQDFLFDYGMIGVVLFVDGRWEWVIIDDLVAVDDRKQPLHLATLRWEEMCALEERYGCSHTKGDRRRPISWDAPTMLELWPLLVLKAMSKTVGSYAALDCSRTISDMVVMLTGCVPLPTSTISAVHTAEDLVQELAETPTSFTLLYPRHPQKSEVWAGLEVECPTNLPCILAHTPVNFEVDSTVAIYCPWGTIRKTQRSTVRLHDPPTTEVHYLVELPLDAVHVFFERVETFIAPNQSYPLVAIGGVMTPSVPTRLALSISTAVQTEILFSLEQSDPMFQTYLPFSCRRCLPFGCISWRICSTSSGEVVLASRDEVRRQQAVYTSLEPGDYMIEILLSMAPAIPFQFSISAPATAVLTLSREGSDPTVHGVCTRFLQASSLALVEAASKGAFDRDLEYSPSKQMLSDVMTRRASRLFKPEIPNEVRDAFSNGDVLQSGSLHEDAAQRALLSLLLKQTPGGAAFIKCLKQSAGGVSLSAFHEAVQAATAAGGFVLEQ